MEIAAIQKPLLEHLNHYYSGIETYDLDTFKYKKESEVWSLCQLYDHLCVSNAFFFLANVVCCLEERKGQIGGEKEIQGAYVIKYNSMNDGRYKGPSGSQQPCAGEDPRDHYGKMLVEQIEDVKVVAGRLAMGFNSEYKCKHPILGWLNALEWFQVLEIHLRHHLRQQGELEAFAADAAKA